MADGTWGCEACWRSETKQAVDMIRSQPVGQNLIDESHFSVRIRTCPTCTQSYVTVFTETIDWADGEDPQHTTIMPLTQGEVASLAVVEERSVPSALVQIGAGRETLEYDFPKGSDPRTYRNAGLQIRSHD